MRNPLSTALWSAELLARLSPEERGGARGDKLAGMCLRSLQRLRLLIEDHFLAERLAVSGMPVRFEAVPIREALESILPKSGIAGAALEIASDLAASADRGLLERALEGLLATVGRGGTPVTVSARRDAGGITIRFEGAKPAPDALEPPQKGTASDPTGRALAMHMVAHVARALGGDLTLAQDTFVLTLRAAAPAPGPNAP